MNAEPPVVPAVPAVPAAGTGGGKVEIAIDRRPRGALPVAPPDAFSQRNELSLTLRRTYGSSS